MPPISPEEVLRSQHVGTQEIGARPVPPPPPSAEPETLTVEALQREYEERFRSLQAAPVPSPAEEPPTPPPPPLPDSRFLAAAIETENALRAELAVLRERLGQLTAEVQRVLMGSHLLLQPLFEWHTRHGRTVPHRDLIPLTVQALDQMDMQLRLAPASAAPIPMAQPPGLDASQLALVLERLIAKVDMLEKQGATAQQAHPSWVVTDSLAAQIEQNMANAQRQGHPFVR